MRSFHLNTLKHFHRFAVMCNKSLCRGTKPKRHETQKIRKRDKKRIEFLVAWIVLTALTDCD